MGIITRTNAVFYELDMGYMTTKMKHYMSEPKFLVPFSEGSGATIKELATGTVMTPTALTWDSDNKYAHARTTNGISLDTTVPISGENEDMMVFMFKGKYNGVRPPAMTLVFADSSSNSFVISVVFFGGLCITSIARNGVFISFDVFDTFDTDFIQHGFETNTDEEFSYCVVIDPSIKDRGHNFIKSEVEGVSFTPNIVTISDTNVGWGVYNIFSKAWSNANLHEEQKLFSNKTFDPVKGGIVTTAFDANAIQLSAEASESPLNLIGYWTIDKGVPWNNVIEAVNEQIDHFETDDDLTPKMLRLTSKAALK